MGWAPYLRDPPTHPTSKSSVLFFGLVVESSFAGRTSGAESRTHAPLPGVRSSRTSGTETNYRDSSLLGSVPVETIPHPEGLQAVPMGEPEAVWATAVTMDPRSEV